MKTVQLGTSDLQVTPICLGTMTFGEQVSEINSHAILDHAIDRGINFIDTAEMYSVPPRADTFNLTEKIIGHWLQNKPSQRDKILIATKVAGPSRGMPWVRGGSPDLTAKDIREACHNSLKRLNIDCIDLYQIHWPVRHVPAFGIRDFNPAMLDSSTSSIHEQLEALGQLVSEGKVRAVGLSNETPYGLGEFIKMSELHGLPRVASVQNPYCLVNRLVENALDESLYHYKVALLAYSPLAFGLLTGKYDASGTVGPNAPQNARIAKFESVRKQRWGRESALVASRLYNALARDHGLTPTQMALAFCYTKWQVTSTIIGVTSIAQLDENCDALGTTLDPAILEAIDAIRAAHKDPAY